MILLIMALLSHCILKQAMLPLQLQSLTDDCVNDNFRLLQQAKSRNLTTAMPNHLTLMLDCRDEYVPKDGLDLSCLQSLISSSGELKTKGSVIED